MRPRKYYPAKRRTLNMYVAVDVRPTGRGRACLFLALRPAALDYEGGADLRWHAYDRPACVTMSSAPIAKRSRPTIPMLRTPSSVLDISRITGKSRSSASTITCACPWICTVTLSGRLQFNATSHVCRQDRPATTILLLMASVFFCGRESRVIHHHEDNKLLLRSPLNQKP